LGEVGRKFAKWFLLVAPGNWVDQVGGGGGGKA